MTRTLVQIFQEVEILLTDKRKSLKGYRIPNESSTHFDEYFQKYDGEEEK
jgi:hypothetical protein